jgi:RecB family exonuclease
VGDNLFGSSVKRISNSELKTFKRCRRQWWLSYVRRLRRRKADLTGPAQLGTRVHAALAEWYGGIEDPLLVLDEILNSELADNPNARDEIIKEDAFARLIVEGYLEWLEETGADVDLEVLDVEREIEAESPFPGVNLIGKEDLYVRKRSQNFDVSY